MLRYRYMNMLSKIPPEVTRVTQDLERAGYEAYLVGGCVRDLLIGRKPKDWDVTTNANPDEIMGVFPHTFYENSYGTVGVVNEEVEDETIKVVEVTPYRIEEGYSDNRRPDSVIFSDKLEDDLKRRDFTINAIAIRIKNENVEIVDLYGGKEDLDKKTIRTVGKPEDRFGEDALRTLRAIRIAAELGFVIEEETEQGITKMALLLDKISKERIRDEFSRILMSEKPMEGLLLAEKLGVLPYISKDLVDSIGVEQNRAHSYDVWEHLLRSLQHAASKNWPLHIRLAALFHDIGKPVSRRKSPKTGEWTFYGHEVVGERMVKKILADLRYPKDIIDRVSKLVRWHMFFSDTELITLSAVRRMIANVGKENVWDLMNVRASDRIGTGRPKENPYRLRKYKAMIEEAMRDPITVGMLKVDGKEVVEIAKTAPGPKIGLILHALLDEVLDDPKRNTKEYLVSRVTELSKLPDNELEKLGEQGKEAREKVEEEVVGEIRKKHHVK